MQLEQCPDLATLKRWITSSQGRWYNTRTNRRSARHSRCMHTGRVRQPTCGRAGSVQNTSARVQYTSSSAHPRRPCFSPPLSSRFAFHSWTRFYCRCLLALLLVPSPPPLSSASAREGSPPAREREGSGGGGGEGDGGGAVEVEGRLRPPHQAAADWGQRCVPASTLLPLPPPLPSTLTRAAPILPCSATCALARLIVGLFGSFSLTGVNRRQLLVLFPVGERLNLVPVHLPGLVASNLYHGSLRRKEFVGDALVVGPFFSGRKEENFVLFAD